MSDSSEGPIEWVETDKFVMPVIPEKLGIDPRTLAVLHCVSFLELSGDNTVDPDWAVEALEHVAHYLLRLGNNDLAELKRDTAMIASWAESKQMPPHFIDLVRHFTDHCGFEPEE
ncbi:leucine-rich repeat domain-containing protein [Chthoniobacter flavus]|uniref:hypothetical protein n=1 Tax=Chthoniobacter flavus TaxID=191863 RepID=UPI00104E5651|nr:hypothetical protein [Chthoniobacter flavus]